MKPIPKLNNTYNRARVLRLHAGLNGWFYTPSIKIPYESRKSGRIILGKINSGIDQFAEIEKMKRRLLRWRRQSELKQIQLRQPGGPLLLPM